MPIAGLVAARFIWGFIGSRHARFRSFVRPPREVLAYLRDLALLRAPRYLGHNPAGGAMIIALLATLTATCITGYMMTTDAFWGSKWIEEVHETSANLVMVSSSSTCLAFSSPASSTERTWSKQ